MLNLLEVYGVCELLSYYGKYVGNKFLKKNSKKAFFLKTWGRMRSPATGW